MVNFRSFYNLIIKIYLKFNSKNEMEKRIK